MNKHQTIWASLDAIRINARTTRSLSAATVEQYREWLEQGREAPAVRLAPHGDGFVVRDGRHRVAAALAAGHRFIEAEVRPIARLIRRLRITLRAARLAARTRGRALESASRLHRAGRGFDSHRLHQASVVSTASTRPLYGRGAGSTPAGGS